MKVIQVIGGGEKGGSRKYIIQLCRGLIERGHTAEIVCFLEDAVSASAREHEIPVTVLPMGNIFDLRAVSYLKRHIKERCPDLVHTHGVRGNFVGRLAAKGAGVTVVTTVHSSVYQDYSHPLKKLLYHRIEKATRRYSSRFIAVAGSLKEELERDGIYSEKIDVVYNGITPDFIQDYSDYAIREELELPPEVPILITVGRAEAVKNQEVFLRVCASLKEQDIDFHGLLVGDGPLLPELRKKSKALGLDDCVSFLGFRNDIFRLLSEADVFILTSRMEGLPITLLEAMAAGTPAIVSSVGGMPEVIHLAGNGWTVGVDDVGEYARKVRFLLENVDLRNQMARRGQTALKEYFSHTAFVSGTLAVYSRALQKR